MNLFFAKRFSAFIAFLLVPAHLSLAALPEFIKEISVPQDGLSYGGRLTAIAVPKILAKAFQDKIILHDAFKDEACLTAKALGTGGSFNTQQLFSVSSTCTDAPISFIIKEAVHGEAEARSLHAVEQLPGIQPLMSPKIAPRNNLNVALPLAYLSYKDSWSQTHILALMPYARGRVLCDVIKEFRDDQSDDKGKMIRANYFTLGTQLANFHKKVVAKSPNYQAVTQGLVHGDLHCLNIFFDTKDNVATLIDNETIASSLSTPANPDDDILKLFLGAFSKWEPEERKDYIHGLALNKWFDTAFSGFVDGYANAFKPTERNAVLKDLKAMFNADKLPSWMSLDSVSLATLRSEQINRVLDEKLAPKK